MSKDTEPIRSFPSIYIDRKPNHDLDIVHNVFLTQILLHIGVRFGIHLPKTTLMIGGNWWRFYIPNPDSTFLKTGPLNYRDAEDEFPEVLSEFLGRIYKHDFGTHVEVMLGKGITVIDRTMLLDPTVDKKHLEYIDELHSWGVRGGMDGEIIYFVWGYE